MDVRFRDLEVQSKVLVSHFIISILLQYTIPIKHPLRRLGPEPIHPLYNPFNQGVQTIVQLEFGASKFRFGLSSF